MKSLYCILCFLLVSHILQAQYIITTIAGTGIGGFSGDGSAATAAQIQWPLGVCADKAGNVYIADDLNGRIRKIDLVTGTIATIAGDGTGANTGNGGLAVDAQLWLPTGICLDDSENIYISCWHCVRKISAATGIITMVAGVEAIGGYSGDGGSATDATLGGPHGIAISKTGDIYIGDRGSHVIRKVEKATGIITTYAGKGTPGFSGDGGPATAAQLNFAGAIAIDTGGNIYLGDNGRIRKIDAATGIISTIGGTGLGAYLGDGGDVIHASFYTPCGIGVDQSLNIYISDQGSNAIRKVDAVSHIITTIAGTGDAGFSGDGGGGKFAEINLPYGIYVNNSGSTVYIADKANHRIRKLYNPTASVNETTVADGQTITVFPNPSTGLFNLSISNNGNYFVNICNTMGQIVFQSAFNGNTTSIDLSQFPSGIYFLHLNAPDETFSQKLVITR